MILKSINFKCQTVCLIFPFLLKNKFFFHFGNKKRFQLQMASPIFVLWNELRVIETYLRIYSFFSLCRLMSEMRYPTLTSTGDPKKIVTSLGLNRISTMILSGKPNRWEWSTLSWLTFIFLIRYLLKKYLKWL